MTYARPASLRFKNHAVNNGSTSICAAMEGLTRALAVELAPIRVNIVSPGVVKTPLWGGMPEADRAALYDRMATSLPVGHVAEPDPGLRVLQDRVEAARRRGYQPAVLAGAPLQVGPPGERIDERPVAEMTRDRVDGEVAPREVVLDARLGVDDDLEVVPPRAGGLLPPRRGELDPGRRERPRPVLRDVDAGPRLGRLLARLQRLLQLHVALDDRDVLRGRRALLDPRAA